MCKFPFVNPQLQTPALTRSLTVPGNHEKHRGEAWQGDLHPAHLGDVRGGDPNHDQGAAEKRSWKHPKLRRQVEPILVEPILGALANLQAHALG